MTGYRSPELSRFGPSDVFVLVHSPLLTAWSWEPVADRLRRVGILTSVPDLHGAKAVVDPFWKRHVDAVVGTLHGVPADQRLILVGHSGAGALLPSIGHSVRHAVAGYVFVDAHIPRAGESRLGDGPFADFIRQLYADGGRYPNWTDEDLREDVPDADLRRRLLAELRPPPLAFWEEPIPVPPAWPDAPCGFLRFVPNPAYDAAADEARRQGWVYAELAGGHFHPLVDPAAVAESLRSIVVRLLGERHI